MTDAELLSRIAAVVSHALVHDVTLTPEMTANDVEGWDSLSHTIIMMQLERDLGITIPVQETFALRDVAALLAFVRTRLAAAQGGA